MKPARPRRWILRLCALFALATGTFAHGADYVLAIASYHPGFAWTDGQLRGLRETLAKRRPELTLRVEYLDTKHAAPNADTQRAVSALLAAKYGSQRPLLVVAQDDDALDLVLRQREADGLFSGLPVVFSGVSGSRAEALRGQPALTGVFDDADIAANIELLQRIRPGLQTVHFIHDQSRTGKAQADNIRLLQQRFSGLKFSFLTDASVAAIKTRLAGLGETDAVIALAFNRDSDGLVLDHFQAAAHWGKAATVPVLVKEEEMMAPGILGGILLSGHRDGSLAASLVLQILDGSRADSLPPHNGTSVPLFSNEVLQRFGIREGMLPIGAEIVGREQPLRVTHPREFWVTVTLFAAATIVIPLLLLMSFRERRAKRTALASERNYREIFNAGNEAVIVHDTEGRILDVNDRFRAMFDYPAEIPLPKTAQALVGDISRYGEGEALANFQRCLTEGPQLFERQTRRRDGSLFWAEIALRAAVISGEERVIAAVRDISTRKEAETRLHDSETRYDLLLRESPVGIMHLSADWTLSYCNDRFTEIISAPRSAIVGSDMRKLRDRSILPALTRALTGTESAYQGEYTSTASGRSFQIDLRAAPVRNDEGGVIGAIVIIDDITDRIAAERTLKAFNERLEQGIAERTEALTRVNRELNTAMRQLAESEKLAALGALVAGVSHELNTPIGNARMLATTLADLATGFNADLAAGSIRKSELERFVRGSQEAATNLDRNLERAATLIGNFKQLAVDQSSMMRRRFSLAEVAAGTLALVSRRIEKASCTTQVTIAPDIEMDGFPGAIEQILMNLVTNSLTHAFEGRQDKRIDIRATQSDGTVRLEYADNGTGMSEETARHALEPFYTTKFGQGGSGLGLYIVHNMVTGQLGGTLQIETAPGKGCLFCIRLPARAPERSGA